VSCNDAPVFDAEQLIRILESHDELVLCEFYELFLQQLAELLTVFGNAGPSFQPETIQLFAHKLKSSALSVGAMRLGAQLAALEECCLMSSPAGIELLMADVVSTALQTETAVRERLLRSPV